MTYYDDTITVLKIIKKSLKDKISKLDPDENNTEIEFTQLDIDSIDNTIEVVKEAKEEYNTNLIKNR